MTRYKKRYQHQPWYIKLFLNIRYELPVPYYAVKMWIKLKLFKSKEMGNDLHGLNLPNDWKFCWSLSKGIADCDKNHVYPAKEAFRRVRKRIDGNKQRTKPEDGG